MTQETNRIVKACELKATCMALDYITAQQQDLILFKKKKEQELKKLMRK